MITNAMVGPSHTHARAPIPLIDKTILPNAIQTAQTRIVHRGNIELEIVTRSLTAIRA